METPIAAARSAAPVIEEFPYPESAFAAFSSVRAEPGSFLLESALVDGRLGRYSFLGARPFLTITTKGRAIELRERGTTVRLEGNPFRVLRDLLARYRLERPAGAPPLLAGAVGYFGYDLRHFVERVPAQAVDDVPIPECHLGFYDTLLAVDHVERRAWVVAADFDEPRQFSRDRAAERLRRFREVLGRPVEDPVLTPVARSELVSNFTRPGYLAAIRRAKEYIAAGDIYQVNLSQRFATPTASAYDLYRRLREINPAPFAAYFEVAGGPSAESPIAVVCASPERFLRLQGDRVETRPIKGTRPRGATPEEDQRLAHQLLNTEKDRAENVMIVDLERNDLGRVCAYGSVRVSELCALETYATVFHLVSTVEGRLHEGMTAVDLLKSCFPGGSITGAPKVRAIEIIDELEPTGRGLYTGALGYLDFSGDLDLNIVIRTLVVKNGVAYFQVGGGIVADSDPEAEYQETLDKGRALVSALSGAGGPAAVEARWAG